MIIIVHNRHFILENTDGYRQLINYGQMGCQLFFLISGISLCFSWHRPTSENFTHRYIHFIKRRYLRLAPGFLIMLFIHILINIISIKCFNYIPGVYIDMNPLGILINILFLHGFSPSFINSVFPGGWYIGTAFILYLVFPFFAILFDFLHKKHRYMIYGIPFVTLCVNILVLKLLTVLSHGNLLLYNNSFLYFFFTNQLPCFFLGMVFYYQFKDSKLKYPIWASFALFIITSFIAVYVFMKPDFKYAYGFIPTLSGISFYWLTVLLVSLENRSRSGFFATFLSKCGQNSYEMYLTHSFVCWYGMKALTDFLSYKGIAYNDILLYLILLLPSIIAVYYLGKLTFALFRRS
jgi:peptidoglycan/LPS O-acetylase OafA/YrhL